MLSDDLREACMGALRMSRETCRSFALGHSWERSAQQFVANLSNLNGSVRTPRAA
jgi:hypothetical protein